ncbi:efflux RND transporter periplasmic adaptor subunit [Paracoccus suum]|uniref:Efflux RND transporter periplasmic adaptor subunit n=1 Tax=Paracoccus suum TaxID=2259340 RepID=A0A344PGX9_9RHOB|nr:efflux RND transporter periplasmic adaptor subunit [Paracoccus suum]AXC48634.1 efflux RND transporter periplasmic adaptor subunit [Paracoccus suum]
MFHRPIAAGLLALSLAGLAPGAPALAQVPGQMPPKQVGVVEMQLQPVPRIVTLPGRAVAGAEAAIRPRVSGMVTEILYDPAVPLKAGAPMFRLDATTYQSGVVTAEANVESAQAASTEADAAAGRAKRLLGSGSTRVQADSAQAAADQAAAQLRSAKAALDVAKAELGWTTITSPIDGFASVAAVSVGDLVTANQGEAMATVTRLDPIEVDILVPSVRLQSVIDDIESGRLKMNKTLNATLTLENGQTYKAKGELVAPGFSVSTTTGSVDNRFRFENPDRRLLPGMFLRGTIELGTTQAFLVSQSAATRDRIGELSVWVVEDGKVVQRKLKDDGSWNNNWIITDGLKAGDLVVADNLTGLTAGTAVQTLPVTYDEQGVVRAAQATPAGGAPAATPTDGAASPAAKAPAAVSTGTDAAASSGETNSSEAAAPASTHATDSAEAPAAPETDPAADAKPNGDAAAKPAE